MQKKKRKKLMIGISVAAAAAVVTVVALPMASVGRAASELPDAFTQTAMVERGTIETTVVGSGSLSATGTVDVDIPSGLVLDSISVEVGDRVEAGDTLAVINAASLEDMIGEVQDAIDGIDSGIASAQEDSGNATIEASVGGRVKEIYAAEGDDIKDVISRNGSFIVMSLDGKMKVEFTSEAPLSAGDDVTVVLADGTEKDGEVESASGGACTVTLTDNGPEHGSSATVLDGEGNTLGSGVLEISSPLEIMSGSGTAESVDVDVDDYVEAGDTLITLTETVASREYGSMSAERAEYAAMLMTLLEYSETGEIRAETGGTVAEVNISAGSAASASAAGDSSDSTSGGAQAVGMSSAATADGGSVILLDSSAQDGGEAAPLQDAQTPVQDGQTAGGADTNITPQDTQTPVQDGQTTDGTGAADTNITEIGGTIEVYINNPVTGNTPQSTIMPGQGYTGAITWSPETMQFAAGTAYTATVTLTAAEGYGFAADTAVNVKGAQTDPLTYVNTGGTFTFNAVFQPTGTDAAQVQNNLQAQNQQAFIQNSAQSAASGGAVYSSGGAAAQSSTAAESSSEDSAVSNSAIERQTAFVITTGDIVTMTASVDELDILSLEEGQEASIVLDALPDETISGVVAKVSETGTSQAGVTTYPVTVRLDIPEGMTVKPGMNASATIVTGASENTLMIPLAALQEAGGEKFVMVGTEGAPGGEDTSAQAGVSAAQGERRTVETGLSDGDSVEVLSGLEKGETVVYVQPAGEDGGEASGMEMMFGNGGGMPGGGNMPSGGGMGGPPQ